MRERHLGIEHLGTASAMNNLAVLLKAAGAYPEAEALFKRSIKIKQNLLGNSHPQVTQIIIIL